MSSSYASIIRQHGTNTLGCIPFSEYEYSKSELFSLVERGQKRTIEYFSLLFFKTILVSQKLKLLLCLLWWRLKLNFFSRKHCLCAINIPKVIALMTFHRSFLNTALVAAACISNKAYSSFFEFLICTFFSLCGSPISVTWCMEIWDILIPRFKSKHGNDDYFMTVL